MLLALSLLATLMTGDTLSGADASRAQGSASFIVQRQPAIPLMALRLAILADDPAGHAGAGHLVQHLVFPALRDQAARVGGVVQMERSADAIIYTVTGPTAELEYLAGVLRTALQPPRPTQGELLSANRALQEERLAEYETADRHIRASLRTRVFPNDLSAAGTVGSARRLTLEALPAVWAEMYRPERVSIVAVGDVGLEEVEAAFRGLPAAPIGRPLPEVQDTTSLAPLAPAQATRAWLAMAHLANDLDPAAVSIAARLLHHDLARRLPTSEVAAEHWWTHYGQALAIVISTPGRDMAATRRTLGTAASTVQRQLTAASVASAARAIRREMLFYGRTTDRMAEVLGRFADRGGEAGAADQFYRDLEEMDVEGVRAVLQHLVTQTPVRREIAPQVLNQTPPEMMRALSLGALLLLALPVAAQERLAIRPEPRTPVVAMEVLIAAGPANEPAGKAGLANLAARTVVSAIQPTIDSLGAHLDIAAQKDALTFTLTAAPDAWEAASRALLVALFRDPPDPGQMAAQQRAIIAELQARQSNPADEAVRAADAAVFGEDHPWGRATVGSAASVRGLTMVDVDAFLRAYVTSRRAVVAVVGPVVAGEARLHLQAFFDPSTALPPPELRPADPSGVMVENDYNAITTWVTVSYAFPATADAEAIQVLARLALDELSFSSLRRSVFDASSEVIPRRTSGELRFQLVTPPEEAEEWASRVRALVERELTVATIPEVLQNRLRRYRGERLHELARPEDRARELARQLLVNGRTESLDVEIEAFTAARLASAARSLGAPTVVLLGPIIDEAPSSGGD